MLSINESFHFRSSGDDKSMGPNNVGKGSGTKRFDRLAQIKVPVLILFMFLLGWLPTFLLYRAKMWRFRQRLDSQERQAAQRVEQPAEDAPVI